MPHCFVSTTVKHPVQHSIFTQSHSLLRVKYSCNQEINYDIIISLLVVVVNFNSIFLNSSRFKTILKSIFWFANGGPQIF